MDKIFGIALLALIPGFIARGKGRSFWGYYFLSFLVTPLISIIVTLCVSNLNKPAEKKPEPSNDSAKGLSKAFSTSPKNKAELSTASTKSASQPASSLTLPAAIPSESDSEEKNNTPTVSTNPVLEEDVETPSVISRENESTSVLPVSRFCRKCGFQLVADSDFCSHCGTKVVTVPQKPFAEGTILASDICG